MFATEQWYTPFIGYASKLMSGGTFEIVLLIVLIVVGLILFLIALWVLWKLLVLLGKGLLWLFRFGGDKARETSQAKRDARLAAPPPVATGWGSSPRIGLRRALAMARRLTGHDALCIVVIAGKGTSNLYRGLGLTPPGIGTIGISAGSDIVLIDASNADPGMLRRLAGALPWRRPIDGVAAIVDSEGISSETLARTASFARALGVRTALHFVFPSTGKTAAWQIIDGRNQNGDEICSRLAADAARIWLATGSRQGLKELGLAQSRELPTALDRVAAAAPSSFVDVASLCLGGAGLRAAVAQTTERTRPAVSPGLAMWAAVAVLVTGGLLAALAAVTAADRASELRATVDSASYEATVPWNAEGIDTIPNRGRIRRISGIGKRLADSSDFSLLMPLAVLAPNNAVARDLGVAFLVNYVLTPLGDALTLEIRERLVPVDDPVRWLENAHVVSEWFAAWEGLSDDPGEVDIRRIFSAAFGGDNDAWAEGTDIALIRTGAKPPPHSLDIDALTELAHENFVHTMQLWADTVYTNGPVASAARRAIDRSETWREQHAALTDLRTALQDPSNQWLTAVKDKPDYAFELRILGRAVGLPLIGQGTALEAKAEVARIRIDAREAAEYFILPDIGPLMVRSSTGGQSGGGPSLSLSPGAEAWLGFLDRVANAGFADMPKDSPPPHVPGTVTVAPSAVAEVRNQLRVFDQFASDLPTNLPPVIAQNLVRELASELVVGVTVGVEQSLRPGNPIGVASEQTQQLARAVPAMNDLFEIEQWLHQRLADDEADRVSRVRARIAEGVLQASAEVLIEEDPLGIYLDPAADGNALVRRFERGVARLRRIYEQFAVPFMEPAGAGGWVAVDWDNIAWDIKAYDRGDATATLSGLEGMLRAYAEDPAATCDAPRPPAAASRDDYVVRAYSRFRSGLDYICRSRHEDASKKTYRALVEYFNRHVAWLWPYTEDRNAPHLPPSTLDAFVEQLHDSYDALTQQIQEPFAKVLRDNAIFWSRDSDGGAVFRFHIEWRTRPSEERLAENIIEVEFEGTDIDENEIHTWRYGAPVSMKLRLAMNSPYRFVEADDPEQREMVFTAGGYGALLQVFSGLSKGSLAFDAPVLDGDGKVQSLRITARITDPEGSPITMPEFQARPTTTVVQAD